MPVPRKEVGPNCFFFWFSSIKSWGRACKDYFCAGPSTSVISSKLVSSSTLKLSTNLHSLAVIPALEWLRMYFMGIFFSWHKRWFQFASAGMGLKYNIWIDGVSRVQGGSALAGFTGAMEQQGWLGLINVFRPHKTLSGALRCLTWRKFALAAGGTEFISLGSRIEGFFYISHNSSWTYSSFTLGLWNMYGKISGFFQAEKSSSSSRGACQVPSDSRDKAHRIVGSTPCKCSVILQGGGTNIHILNSGDGVWWFWVWEILLGAESADKCYWLLCSK